MVIRNMLSFASISIKQVPKEYNTENLIRLLLFIENLILTFIVLSFHTVKSTIYICWHIKCNKYKSQDPHF